MISLQAPLSFVIRTEPDGDVVVERISDGKRVKRPVSKLS